MQIVQSSFVVVFSLILLWVPVSSGHDQIDIERLIAPVDLPEVTSETTTYVRCWHRAENTHDNVKSNWEWALNSDGSYYEIKGYWHSARVLKNMFYTDVPQNTIMERCKATINTTNDKADITFFAADTFASYNYTIWTNDDHLNTKEQKINKIISFGDSLSDTGNIFNGSGWLFPNRNSWFLGHFSNGLLWTEYLAKARSLPLYNWAIGVSASEDKYVVLKGIKSQIHSYENYMKAAKNYNPENTLFSLEFGINDFLVFGTPLGDVKKHFDETMEVIVAAKVKHLIIMLLPDASHVPGFKKQDKRVAAALRKNVIAYNDHIKQKIKEYKAKGLNIITFDVFGLLEQLVANPKKYGFENATDACLSIDKTDTSVYFSSYELTDACKKIGSDKYVFWGNTHPTTTTHKYFSEHLLYQMKPSKPDLIGRRVKGDSGSEACRPGGRHIHDKYNRHIHFRHWDGNIHKSL